MTHRRTATNWQTRAVLLLPFETNENGDFNITVDKLDSCGRDEGPRKSIRQSLLHQRSSSEPFHRLETFKVHRDIHESIAGKMAKTR